MSINTGTSHGNFLDTSVLLTAALTVKIAELQHLSDKNNLTDFPELTPKVVGLKAVVLSYMIHMTERNKDETEIVYIDREALQTVTNMSSTVLSNTLNELVILKLIEKIGRNTYKLLVQEDADQYLIDNRNHNSNHSHSHNQ